LLTVSCAKLGVEEPELNVSKYLSEKESERINQIIFEVQKVLDTVDIFRKSHALAYVQKLDIPGWRVYHKKRKFVIFTEQLFIAEKNFSLPNSCIKDINNAQVNVCHLKIEQNVRKLGEAYNCKVKAEPVKGSQLEEKVKISCSY